MLVGTDYNPGGVKGIGPKTALSLVKKHSDLDSLFKEIKWNDFFEVPWQDIYDLFKKMPVTDKFELKWKDTDKEKILKFLVDEHDFSEERVLKSIDKLLKEKGKLQQKGLGEFFG